jgi:hypothetical protein
VTERTAVDVDESASPTGRRARPDLVAGAIARLRVATDDDNDRILDLMADVPMEGGLVLATRRDPDFFGLYRMQRGHQRLFVFDDEDRGALKGMGGFLVRDGFLDGAAARVGYLGDLRTRGLARERLAFPQIYAHLFARTLDETGCEHFLTAVLAENERAIRALSSSSTKSSRRAAQPHYHLLQRFDMANVHFVGRLPRRKARGVTVRTATVNDIAAITSLLAADHRQRPFGWRFDDGEFEHRLAHWPGFALDHTFCAFADDGRLVGVTTCWDAATVKRYRVVRYAGQMVTVKRALDVVARVAGCAPLPDPGHDFRYLYLTNLSVLDDHPAVMQALVDAIYARFARAGYHFLAFPLYEGDALARGTKGYVVRRVPFHLYAVTSSARARSDWQAGRPGFEMALA